MLKTLLEYIVGASSAIIAGQYKYLMSTSIKTQMQIFSVLRAVRNGKDPSELYNSILSVKKGNLTRVVKAGGLDSSSKLKGRYLPNEEIITTNGVVYNEKTKVYDTIIDVWNDELGSISKEKMESLSDEELKIVKAGMTIKEDTVILSNGDVKYPDDAPDIELRGLSVKGFYQKDGSFIIDQEKGTDTLQDEYLSNVSYVKDAYDVKASHIPVMAVKGGKSYAFQQAPDTTTDSKGNTWEISKPIAYIIINTDKNGKIIDPSVVVNAVFERTYQEKIEEGVYRKIA